MFQGIKKKMNSSFPLGQATLQFCLPLGTLSFLRFFFKFLLRNKMMVMMMMIMTLSLPFNYLVGTGFGRSCDHWASENEKKKIAQQENLLVLDTRSALFLRRLCGFFYLQQRADNFLPRSCSFFPPTYP